MAKSRKTKHQVFLVAEHPVTRYGVSHLINQEPDLEVCGESDCGSAALTAVAIAQPHAVVIEVALNGISLIKDLHELDPNLSILVLSAQEESTHLKRCLRAGAKGYLLMTEPVKTVLLALRHVVAGEVYLSEHTPPIPHRR